MSSPLDKPPEAAVVAVQRSVLRTKAAVDARECAVSGYVTRSSRSYHTNSGFELKAECSAGAETNLADTSASVRAMRT